MFAKIFDTKYGQVLVKLDVDDENVPEIRFYSKPEGLGVCSVAFSYTNESTGSEDAEEGFAKVTLQMAETAAKELNVYSGI